MCMQHYAVNKSGNELVIGQTTFTRCDEVEEVWQQVICCDMFL